MASSCPNNFPLYHHHHQLSDQDAEAAAEEDEDNMLELGLGLGLGLTQSRTEDHIGSSSASASASASASSPSPSFQLGLGLGFGNEAVRNSSNSGSSLAMQPACNHGGWWNQPHGHDHHHDGPSLTLLTSPAWPWRLDSDGFLHPENLQLPVPKATHDYRRRSELGLWFSLRSSVNQEGETLPQIPKAYIRVKDENVTVFMVKTYLVTKLGLTNEAEIEISCAGLDLLHSQTLKSVRDIVWLPKFLDEVAPMKEKSHNYLMCLHYRKCCSLEYQKLINSFGQ
ncbi:PREDICTED: uncharacterized protein LOC104596826 [Nelumbo nucifera]|uniref:Uncharacterized protein n=2 Tax=Nelumbo nucifera TaxID=4432 RepID=A0A822ZCA9_NELNU|nr:PREDICTED: uncharacterized protein LOC104596826 [Nelumbo nucifera]DAD39168.1 TPA_asm: hypothetical protein HUJ06_013491 [Nelumbo nucifera]